MTVVKFPTHPDRFPVTEEEVQTKVDSIRYLYINQLTEALMETIASMMSAGGFEIYEEEHRKDFALMIEAVRSSLCKTSGLYHPFQDIAENVMKEIEDTGVFEIADEISVKFQDDGNDEQPEAEACT